MKISSLIKSFLALLIVLTSQQLFSQKNLIEGVVMTNDGIELKGSINYQQWEINPSSIDFYKSTESMKEVLTPEDLRWFKVSDDYYVSKKIKYTKSPRNVENLSFSKTYADYSKLAFCLVLVEGQTSLIEYVDEWATVHYFIEKGEKETVELVYYRYFTKQGHSNTRAIAENKKYQGQLAYLFSDCSVVKKKSTTLAYESKPISKLVKEYNSCKGDSISYFRVSAGPNVRFGVSAGVSFTGMSFNDPDPGYHFLTKDDQGISVNPVIGGSIYVTPQRGLGKWVIYADLLTKAHYFEGESQEYHNEDYYINYSYNYGALYLKLSAQARYNFVGGKWIPYLGGGFFFSKTIAYKNNKVTDKYFYNQHTTKTSPLFDNGIRSYDYGLVGETGVYYRKFNLGIRYEAGGVGQANSYTNTIYVLFTYLF